MTYEEFSKYLANYGFIGNPIFEEEFHEISTLPINTLYGIACDVNAGISFARAVSINKERNENAPS